MSVSAIKGVNELVKLCIAHGVEHVVVSPGSRNAPLSITFDAHPQIQTWVIPDERSAAFFAIGISLATNKPVAVVCTSGSAAYNYAPAVSEAYYQKIPLIVLTADRPNAWINQGDGQTIMQENIYGKHVLFSAGLPLVQDNESAWFHNRLVNEALLKAQGFPKGPVHINVPFTEPLYRLVEPADEIPRAVQHHGGTQVDSRILIDHIAAVMAHDRKVLFLAGQVSDQQLANELSALFDQKPNVVVLSETTSNLRGEGIYTTIDRLIDGLNAVEKKAMAPDVLVTFGDALVSKKVKAWLRQVKLTAHIHIGYEHNLLDTYQSLTHWIEMPCSAALKQLLSVINFPADYYRQWNERTKAIAQRHHTFVKQAPWSDFKVFDFILPKLENTIVHLGNSSPVRYAQLFDMAAGAVYFGNRGTSGIDGSASTAVGYAAMTKQTNVLITGDISFYYDSNAFWNKYLTGNVKIVLINNSGGNIFRIIDGPGDERLTQQYFEAKQELKAEDLCKQFGIRYHAVANEKELAQQFVAFMEACESPSLIEIFTDNIVSPQTLKEYFNFLKS